MSDLPPPSAERSFATPPTFIPTGELLFRFRRLLLAMAIAAAVLAVLPIPSFVHVLILLAAPVLVLLAAISYHDTKRNRFTYRYVRTLWEYRHDPVALAEAGERAREPVSSGLRRAWLLLGLFVAVFVVGLLLAGISAGISEGLYG